MFPFPFQITTGNGNGNWNINFIGELSSRAHFKGNFMLIKNQIGTIPLKSLVSHFWEGVICSCSNYTSSRNPKTSDSRGMVPIWFLIYIKIPLKWAVDESSPIKLMFPFPFPISAESGNENIYFIGELSSRVHFKGNLM